MLFYAARDSQLISVTPPDPAIKRENMDYFKREYVQKPNFNHHYPAQLPQLAFVNATGLARRLGHYPPPPHQARHTNRHSLNSCWHLFPHQSLFSHICRCPYSFLLVGFILHQYIITGTGYLVTTFSILILETEVNLVREYLYLADMY